jgi:diadenosine tetraphosphate (Ap4A) HIT family hydrolase
MCELCAANDILIANELAYVRFDNNGLSRGHALIVPRRHVANFFEMTRRKSRRWMNFFRRRTKRSQRVSAPTVSTYWLTSVKPQGRSACMSICT